MAEVAAAADGEEVEVGPRLPPGVEDGAVVEVNEGAIKDEAAAVADRAGEEVGADTRVFFSLLRSIGFIHHHFENNNNNMETSS